MASTASEPVMPYLLSTPLTCTACKASWTDWPDGFDPCRAEFGMIIICQFCGHAMSLQPPFRLKDFTRAEAEVVRVHQNFPSIRAMQEQIVAKMWG